MKLMIVIKSIYSCYMIYISGVYQLSKNDYTQISLNQLVKNPN